MVEREDLIHVAREALVRSAPRCRVGDPPAPYLRRCITGALQHHLRNRVRLVRVPRRLHEQGQCPLRHLSLDASGDCETCLLDQLPAAQATALRLPHRHHVVAIITSRVGVGLPAAGGVGEPDPLGQSLQPIAL